VKIYLSVRSSHEPNLDTFLVKLTAELGVVIIQESIKKEVDYGTGLGIEHSWREQEF
jgi:hypothetical protein